MVKNTGDRPENPLTHGGPHESARNLHKHQAKGRFERYRIPIPRGNVAATAADAEQAAADLGGGRWVVKAQVHAGGRDKAGGVALVDSPERVRAEAERLLGTRLVTRQSGAEGLPLNRMPVELRSDH